MDKRNIPYPVVIYGVKEVLRRYQRKVINGISYIFLGVVENKEDVPNVNCIYCPSYDASSDNNPVIIRKVNFNRTPTSERLAEHMSGKAEILSEGESNSDPLKITIRKEDDELMVLMKQVLIENGITVGDLRRLYGDDRRNDLNNDRARLEKKETLSWKKFVSLLHLLGFKYSLSIEKDLGEEDYAD